MNLFNTVKHFFIKNIDPISVFGISTTYYITALTVADLLLKVTIGGITLYLLLRKKKK